MKERRSSKFLSAKAPLKNSAFPVKFTFIHFVGTNRLSARYIDGWGFAELIQPVVEEGQRKRICDASDRWLNKAEGKYRVLVTDAPCRANICF